MPSGEMRHPRMACDRCHRRNVFASEWDVHVSFDLGQILCPRCYLRVGSWRQAELTGHEAEQLRTGMRASS